MIAAQRLGKSFGRATALRGIDLEVRRGETVALLGANGAGKTTLLRILATLDKPTTGALEIAGQDALRNAGQVRSRLGLVGHQTYLHPELTPLEDLRFYGRLYGLAGVDTRARKLLQWCGLDAHSTLRVDALSRGRQQRLALARALMHDPELLLLDEPDTGLDRDGVALLEAVLRDEQRTVVFSSHNREWAMALAGRAVVLEAGRIANGG